MPDRAEQLATTIMNIAGTHAPGSFDLILLELRRLPGEPDLHQRVALELIAASGLSAPGTFQKLEAELRKRHPTEADLDAFVARMKRTVSLKTGKYVRHESLIKPRGDRTAGG